MSLLLPGNPEQLRSRVRQAAFAFRGYNVTNLGRTGELWQIEAYQPILEKWLELGSQVSSDVRSKKVDLVNRVVQNLETSLADYAEAVALVMALEWAQIEILEAIHDVQFKDARIAFGYSLGELTAAAACNFVAPVDAMTVPVSLATDCATLANDVEMGIIFSRSEEIPELAIHKLCERITSEGRGVIGMSAMLSPNSYLVLGQHETLARFKELMKSDLPKSALLKRNPNSWPPMHTPIVRQLYIPDRASVMMESMLPKEGIVSPQVFSLVTGSKGYELAPTREVLRRWVDHPQRLWDAVMFTLREDVNVVIHVGPTPNVIPATFGRLSENVSGQLSRFALGETGAQAVTNLVHRRWLANLLPDRAALLRAPGVQHIILEDWLIENAPS